MEISPFLLAELLFSSFLFGILLGVLNDVNRIIRAFCGQRYSDRKFEKLYSFLKFDREERKTLGSIKALIFIQDILFMLISAFGIIMLNYEFNDGKFRVFSPLAAVCGFLLYYFTMGKLTVIIFEPTVIIIKVLFRKMLRIIFLPIKLIFNSVLALVRKFLNSIKKELEKRGNMRYNNIRTREVSALADNGFLN